jgi:membrane protease YdiL (CAAX protease family)
VNESKVRVWRKIGVYYALTMFFSGAFGVFVLHAGKMDAGNLLYVTGAMWSPALAVFATKAIFAESVRDLPWRWGAARYAWLAYLVPLAYALPVYLIVWLTGLGAFAGPDFLMRIAKDFGWQNFPPALTLILFVVITASLGLVGKISCALGEEIGWRGFLVPELSKVVGFPGIGLISGLMWAVYHYPVLPVLIFADYNAGAPAWYNDRERERPRSSWPLEQREDCDEQTQENSEYVEPKTNCFPATLLFLSDSLTQFSLTLFGQVDVRRIL